MAVAFCGLASGDAGVIFCDSALDTFGACRNGILIPAAATTAAPLLYRGRQYNTQEFHVPSRLAVSGII